MQDSRPTQNDGQIGISRFSKIHSFKIPVEKKSRLGQVRLGQVRLGQVRLGQVRLGQVRLGQVRIGQGRLGQVRLGQVRLGQVRLGQVRLGQVRLGQVRQGQARLGQVMIGLFFDHCKESNRYKVIKIQKKISQGPMQVMFCQVMYYHTTL